MYTNLPNSCLLGIILTISTHSGPQVVYHYPPVTEPNKLSKNLSCGNESILYSHEQGESEKYSIYGSKSIKVSESLDSDYLTHEDFNDDCDNKDQTSLIFSSDSESISGLSDSELSTDYADESSDSESLIDMNSIIDGNISTTLNTIENSYISKHSSNKDLRSRASQISSNKLYQILSDAGSRRTSIFSKTTNKDAEESKTTPSSSSSEDEEPEEDNNSFGGRESLKPFLDNRFFQSGTFQDLSKIFNWDAEFVAEFCCPPKEMCNKRFEFTVDRLCFLGLPIHVYENGRWRKKKQQHYTSSKYKKTSNTISNSSGKPRSSTISMLVDDKSSIITDNERGNHDDSETHTESSFDDKTNLLDREQRRNEDLEKTINMFHVCFVMNPHIVEYNERVDDIYHYIATRFSLILRYLQAKSGYVTKECTKILKIRDKVLKCSKIYKSIRGQANKGRFLYEKILKKSSLARAITKCYTSITNNEIANLEIENDKIISLQIPIKNEFAHLPDLKTNPVLRGSYLSSIRNSIFLEQISDSKTSTYFNGGNDLLDYALLLLDEVPNIIRDLERSSFKNDLVNLIVINLVKHLRPTVPIKCYQYLINEILGTSDDDKNSFQTNMLRSLALHLMYWRHARVILPISSKNTYIVSPLAPIQGGSVDDFDTDHLGLLGRKALIYQYQDIFTERFPSLPSLSSFLNLISTKQPKYFGDIIPSKEHKSIYLNALSWLIRYGYLTQLLTFIWIRVDKRIKIAVDEDLESEGFRKKPVFQERERLPNDNKTIRKRCRSRHGNSPTIKNTMEEDSYSCDNSVDSLENIDYTIILEPERATAIEKRWLYKCIEGQPPDLQLLFGKAIKYFNGKTPIELIITRGVISKNDLKRLLQVLGRYIVEVRHW